MKKLALLFAGTLVILALGCFLVVRAERESGREWRALPGGGEVRIYAVTHGLKHEIQAPRLPWMRRLRGSLHARSWPALRNAWRGETGSASSGGGQVPSLMVWLQVRGRPDYMIMSEAELRLPDGQIFRSRGKSGGSGGDFKHTQTTFYVVPSRAQTLHFVAMLDKERFEFTLRNPAFKRSSPTWQALPLPQTQQVGDVSLTLRALALEPARAWDASQWVVRPSWTLTVGGKPVKDWFSIEWEYLDEIGNRFWDCGLLSEPVWKVRAVVTRTNRFPFPEDAVRWLGTIDPAQPLPAAEAHTLFPLDTEARSRGLKFAGVIWRGTFELKDGAVVKARAAKEVSQRSGVETKWLNETESIEVTVSQAAFVLLLDRSEDAVLVMRDSTGGPVQLECGSHGVPGGTLRIYAIPDRLVRIGTALKAPLELEFLVRPPEPPPARRG